MLFNKFPSNRLINEAIREAAKLPSHSPKRKEYNKIVDDEYAAAFSIEDNFHLAWKGSRSITTIEDAKEVVSNLCKEFKLRPIKNVVYAPQPGVGGEYNARNETIYLSYNTYIPLRVLIHELAHHIVDNFQNISFIDSIRVVFK